MSSLAQSGVSKSVADLALDRVAGIAGKKVADLAVNKVLPALRSMDRKQMVTLAAVAGVGVLLLRKMTRQTSEA